MKNRKSVFCLLIALLLMGGCADEQATKSLRLNEARAYKSVQQADSIYKDTTVLEAIQTMLLTSKSAGNLIEINGWSAANRYVPGKKSSGFDVYFDLRENGNKVEIHWIVDENWMIYPADDTAKALCKTQPAKPKEQILKQT